MVVLVLGYALRNSSLTLAFFRSSLLLLFLNLGLNSTKITNNNIFFSKNFEYVIYYIEGIIIKYIFG